MDDDDVPLSALASKTPKIDDGASLASLVGAGAAKPGRPVAGGPPKLARSSSNVGAPQGRAKGKGKGKRARGSSSSSSSSSDSSSSDSDDGKPRAMKGAMKASKPMQKKKGLKRNSSELQRAGTEEDFNDNGGGAVKKKDRTFKEQLVADLLCRWWYALPDWPPEDQHYEAKLLERNLRKVRVAEWEWLPEEDSKGLRKCYELSQFRGCFRDSKGQLIDLRPMESCPCQKNFMNMDIPTLYSLLVKAYEGQLEDLKNSRYNEDKLRMELKTTLTRVKEKAYQSQQLSGGSRSGQKV